MGIVVGLGFGGWDTAQPVHEALLVVPGDVVGCDVFHVAEGARSGPRRNGESARMHSSLYSPMVVSANALS